MTDTNPAHDVEALRAESDRLFAEHKAMVGEHAAKDRPRRAEMDAALARDKAAYEAEERAWQALEDAQTALRTKPGDPALTADVRDAEIAYQAAREEASAAHRSASDIANRQLQEVTAETTALLELGERARAAQDAYFATDWDQARKAKAAVLDEFAQDVLRRCRWAQAHNDGHPSGAWPTGEQLAVALVLRDREHLAAMDYTPTQAAQRVIGGMYDPPADINAWLARIRTALTTPA